MLLHSLRKGKLVEDQTVLSDLGVQGGQTVQVEIQSADPVNKPLKYTKVSPTYKLPDKVNVKVEIGKYILCSGLCSSRARWPLAPNFCPRATRKSQIFHTNHMLGTLDFTDSEDWAPFNFP